MIKIECVHVRVFVCVSVDKTEREREGKIFQSLPPPQLWVLRQAVKLLRCQRQRHRLDRGVLVTFGHQPVRRRLVCYKQFKF